MATTTGRGSSVKRTAGKAEVEAEGRTAAAVHVVRNQVEELARAGAWRMLLSALEDEVNVYLGRGRHERCVAAGPAEDSAPTGALRPSSAATAMARRRGGCRGLGGT